MNAENWMHVFFIRYLPLYRPHRVYFRLLGAF